MRYIPVASKANIKQHLSDGFNAHAVAAAPSLAWNRDDALQDELVRKASGRRVVSVVQTVTDAVESAAASLRRRRESLARDEFCRPERSKHHCSSTT